MKIKFNLSNDNCLQVLHACHPHPLTVRDRDREIEVFVGTSEKDGHVVLVRIHTGLNVLLYSGELPIEWLEGAEPQASQNSWAFEIDSGGVDAITLGASYCVESSDECHTVLIGRDHGKVPFVIVLLAGRSFLFRVPLVGEAFVDPFTPHYFATLRDGEDPASAEPADGFVTGVEVELSALLNKI